MADKKNEIPRPGLGKDPKSEWPKVSKADLENKPIDRLKPGTDRHACVLAYLKERIDMSDRKMRQFHSRWQVNEMKYQAYIQLDDFEKILKDLNNAGKSPLALNITVPYSFATINTIVTYLLHTFAGRKPIFQVGSNKSETTEAATMMETVLQYNADRVRLVKVIYQFLMDTQIYGVGIKRTAWKTERKLRTVWKEQPKVAMFGIPMGTEKVKVRENKLVYAGNSVDTIDPFMFLPDPRVPMHEVNRRGEFVFWKTYEGKHGLKLMEMDGLIKWVDAAGEASIDSETSGEPASARNLISQGDSIPGRNSEGYGQNFMLTTQGTIIIIPNELGLGDGTPEDDKPQKWIFTVVNNRQIVQAERFDCDHDMHPVAVAEPYSMGYGFGQAGISDYLNPMQDLMSWFLNSHTDNVRTSLNNMMVVDPSKIELQDLMKPGPGKIIRLKKSAYGTDVRNVISQLPVADVTKGHVNDFQMLMKLTDAMSSVTDNLRGLQDSGGRKTATEVRTGGEAAASRLAAQTRLISSQSFVDLTEQMCLNTQQYLDEEFYLQIVGSEGIAKPIHISPEMLVGDFHFPINDGTLPLDRVAMLDVWKEIFLGIKNDQNLTQRFDVFKIFKYIAELGGARNIDQFEIKVNQVSDEQMAAMAGAGNAVPQSELPNNVGGGSTTPGIGGDPSARLIT